MKDPTEFRQRFADWKAGERVYDAGKPVEDDYEKFKQTLPPNQRNASEKTYLPEYEYEATVTPQGTSLEKHKRITNEEDW